MHESTEKYLKKAETPTDALRKAIRAFIDELTPIEAAAADLRRLAFDASLDETDEAVSQHLNEAQNNADSFRDHVSQLLAHARRTLTIYQRIPAHAARTRHNVAEVVRQRQEKASKEQRTSQIGGAGN